jgi:chemotaxis response regulator CheB
VHEEQSGKKTAKLATPSPIDSAGKLVPPVMFPIVGIVGIVGIGASAGGLEAFEAVNQRPIVSSCQRPNLSSWSGRFD